MSPLVIIALVIVLILVIGLLVYFLSGKDSLWIVLPPAGTIFIDDNNFYSNGFALADINRFLADNGGQVADLEYMREKWYNNEFSQCTWGWATSNGSPMITLVNPNTDATVGCAVGRGVVVHTIPANAQMRLALYYRGSQPSKLPKGFTVKKLAD